MLLWEVVLKKEGGAGLPKVAMRLLLMWVAATHTQEGILPKEVMLHHILLKVIMLHKVNMLLKGATFHKVDILPVRVGEFLLKKKMKTKNYLMNLR